VQKATSIVASGVHLFGALIEEPLQELPSARGGGLVERQIPLRIAQPEIRTALFKQLQGLKLSFGAAAMGWCASLAILAIGIRLQVQQSSCGICMTQSHGIMQGCAAIGVDEISGGTTKAY